jgi:hypothetical protein
MAASRKSAELEFELALTGVLDDIYDLPVRTSRDALKKGRSGYATLVFHYQYQEDSDQVKVVVGIKGIAGASFPLLADFADADTIAETAEQCEDLALGLRTLMDEGG